MPQLLKAALLGELRALEELCDPLVPRGGQGDVRPAENAARRYLEAQRLSCLSGNPAIIDAVLSFAPLVHDAHLPMDRRAILCEELSYLVMQVEALDSTHFSVG